MAIPQEMAPEKVNAEVGLLVRCYPKDASHLQSYLQPVQHCHV